MNLQLITHPTFGNIHTEILNNEPLFCAVDVCNTLQLSDTEVALRKLDNDEKLMRKIYASGQNRNMWFVNESGLYNLIFRSNKPEAKAFRKWVTSEVLPCIRQYGCYPAPSKYIPANIREHSNTFQYLLMREIIKVESARVRKRMVSLLDFYIIELEKQL